MEENRSEQSPPKRSLTGPRVVAVTLLAFGALVAYQTTEISQGGGYSAVGPRSFPTIVAVGLMGLALIFLLRTTLKPDHDLAQQTAAEEAATHWPTIGLTLLTLILYPFAIGTLGYIVATTLFFPLVARILGSRRPLRDFLVGLGIAIMVYVGFTRFLGVRLPAGLLPFL